MAGPMCHNIPICLHPQCVPGSVPQGCLGSGTAAACLAACMGRDVVGVRRRAWWPAHRGWWRPRRLPLRGLWDGLWGGGGRRCSGALLRLSGCAGAMRQRKLGSHTPPCHRRMVITTLFSVFSCCTAAQTSSVPHQVVVDCALALVLWTLTSARTHHPPTVMVSL